MKTQNRVKSVLTVAAVTMTTLALTATSASAAVIQPTAATSSVGNIGGGRSIDKTIDGSGLSGVGDILTQTHNVTTGSEYWIGAGTSAQLDFDLGGTFDVDSAHLWNYVPGNGTTNRGLGSVDILFSTNGGATYGGLVNVSFAQATIGTPAPPETQSFSAVSGVTHIRLNANNSGSTTHTAFMELRFGSVEAAAGTPEPSTAILAALGLLGLAGTRRRRIR